jgi:hypothetical protein
MTSGTARGAIHLAKALTGWLFLFAVCGLYLLVARFNPSVVSQALATLSSLLAQIVPVLVLVSAVGRAERQSNERGPDRNISI